MGMNAHQAEEEEEDSGWEVGAGSDLEVEEVLEDMKLLRAGEEAAGSDSEAEDSDSEAADSDLEVEDSDSEAADSDLEVEVGSDLEVEKAASTVVDFGASRRLISSR